MKTICAHYFPNTVHIDRIIDSITASRVQHWNSSVWGWEMAYTPEWNVAYQTVKTKSPQFSFPGHMPAVGRGAILALISYPNSARFLDMTPDQLRMWIALSEDPAATLLLPVVIELANEIEIA